MRRGLSVPGVVSCPLHSVGQPDLYPGARAYLLDGVRSVPATRPAARSLGQREQAGANSSHGPPALETRTARPPCQARARGTQSTCSAPAASHNHPRNTEPRRGHFYSDHFQCNKPERGTAWSQARRVVATLQALGALLTPEETVLGQRGLTGGFSWPERSPQCVPSHTAWSL